MKAEIERSAVHLCYLRGQTGGLGHGSEAGSGLDSVLLDDAIGGVEGRPGNVNVQVDEERFGSGLHHRRVPDVETAARPQNAGGLPDGLSLGVPVHEEQGEEAGDVVKGGVGKVEGCGVNQQLFTAAWGLVQLILPVVDGRDLPAPAPPDDTLSAAADVR